MNKNFRFLLSILILIIAMLACENSGDTSVEVTEIPEFKKTEEVEEPTPTKPKNSPTPKFTSTPSPLGYATVTTNLCNLRSGPGTDYSVIGTSEKENVFPVYGKNNDGTWLWVDWKSPVWIATSLVDLDVDISEIKVVMQEEVVDITDVDQDETEQVIAETPEPDLTQTPSVTPIPDSAGLTEWMVYKNLYVGVKDISWDYYFGYFVPEKGEVFLSLYIIAINNSNSSQTFKEGDFGVIDGNKNLQGHTLFSSKEPSFGRCTVRSGGKCEGWWSTIVLDQPDVKENITLFWDPCLFCERIEIQVLEK
jgi:hypothetical protein